MRVALLDNYDSFVYNLYQALGELGADVTVRRNDEVTLGELSRIRPDAIVISPGPGHPAVPRDFGVCGEILATMSKSTPTLGVCLGHQGFAHAYGAKVCHAPKVMHGKASAVHHDGTGLFAGLPDPFPAGRYHSLMVSPELPPHLRLTAWTDDGLVMGIRHERYPIEGVQFHPESILTPEGSRLMANFLDMARRGAP